MAQPDSYTNPVGQEPLDAALGTAGYKGTQGGFKRDDYQVALPVFEGPLDLLLHLIRKEQINIYDIPIAKICQNYMAHLEHMRQIDVNIAGEFMVMAATLMVIKSFVLLPREGGDEAEEGQRLDRPRSHGADPGVPIRHRAGGAQSLDEGGGEGLAGGVQGGQGRGRGTHP